MFGGTADNTPQKPTKQMLKRQFYGRRFTVYPQDKPTSIRLKVTRFVMLARKNPQLQSLIHDYPSLQRNIEAFSSISRWNVLFSLLLTSPFTWYYYQKRKRRPFPITRRTYIGYGAAFGLANMLLYGVLQQGRRDVFLDDELIFLVDRNKNVFKSPMTVYKLLDSEERKNSKGREPDKW